MKKDLPGIYNNKASRRKFLKRGAWLSVLTAGAALTNSALISAQSSVNSIIHQSGEEENLSGNEVLYNGIVLPSTWPPQNMKPDLYDPMPLPYLVSPPLEIPIDIGRQLFIDDFLIEYTDLERKFHQPVKYENNPVLRPETNTEMEAGYCPVASAFSDGCFYDPQDKIFKLWYMAGWFNGTALVTSKDGLTWNRPSLDVVPGTNLVLPLNDLRRDGASIWLDHVTKDPNERYKMYLYARQGNLGDSLKPYGAFLLKSPDGIHWKQSKKITVISDNNTFFYNPFRDKWVFTIRKEGRPNPPWSDSPIRSLGRARSYWEDQQFEKVLTGLEGSVFWMGADRLDTMRADYPIGEDPQIYKIDAVGYESLLIGLIQIHYGPSNAACAKGGFPKLTELQIAFSRDGFHWDRSCRETFIGAKPNLKEDWERGYIHSVGGVCNIVEDKLHFYYTAFKGDESNKNPIQDWNGLYSNGSMGLAILRRDGFASMETTKKGILLTRKIKFTGEYFFVNADSSAGVIKIEVCSKDGIPYEEFTKEDCLPVSVDSTRYSVKWKQYDNLEKLKGKTVRIKFYLNNAKIYSFWISNSVEGLSAGATAAGGPGLSGIWDV